MCTQSWTRCGECNRPAGYTFTPCEKSLSINRQYRNDPFRRQPVNKLYNIADSVYFFVHTHTSVKTVDGGLIDELCDNCKIKR